MGFKLKPDMHPLRQAALNMTLQLWVTSNCFCLLLLYTKT